MAHRVLLTESQRVIFHAPASDERGMVRHYTLSAEDLALINRRRGGRQFSQTDRTPELGSGPRHRAGARYSGSLELLAQTRPRGRPEHGAAPGEA